MGRAGPDALPAPPRVREAVGPRWVGTQVGVGQGAQGPGHISGHTHQQVEGPYQRPMGGSGRLAARRYLRRPLHALAALVGRQASGQRVRGSALSLARPMPRDTACLWLVLWPVPALPRLHSCLLCLSLIHGMPCTCVFWCWTCLAYGAVRPATQGCRPSWGLAGAVGWEGTASRRPPLRPAPEPCATCEALFEYAALLMLIFLTYSIASLAPERGCGLASSGDGMAVAFHDGLVSIALSP